MRKEIRASLTFIIIGTKMGLNLRKIKYAFLTFGLTFECCIPLKVTQASRYTYLTQYI